MALPASKSLPVNTTRYPAVESVSTHARPIEFTRELAAESVQRKAVQFDRQAVASISVERASQTSLRATHNYEPLDPDKHEIATEVKAVTYHQLRIAPEGERWVGRVILDL